MKSNELLMNKIDKANIDTNINTAIQSDSFLLTDEEKIKRISVHFKEIMCILGMNPDDESLKKTPQRVAKMYVKEIFSGLNPFNKPALTLFDNNYKYGEMVIEKNITLYSYCEHHFVPIIGKAHVAYIPNGKVIGLSKINRLVQYYAKRPQVQERLTIQIVGALKDVLHSADVAIIIDAVHHCVSCRGVKDTNSSTTTSHYSGKFKQDTKKIEFISFIK